MEVEKSGGGEARKSFVGLVCWMGGSLRKRLSYRE